MVSFISEIQDLLGSSRQSRAGSGPGYHGSWEDPPTSASWGLGFKAFLISFYCILFVTMSNCVDWTKSYILFSIPVLYGVFGIVLLQQAGRGQKTFIGEFSPVNLAPRDWAQFTGFVSSNICNFFLFLKLRNCVWVGIILSRPERYLTSSKICKRVRS